LSSTAAPAGPSGIASLPPAWLAARSLPLLTISAGTPLFRVHQAIHRPILFGPATVPATGVREPPTNRFDSLTGAFGVFYLGRQFDGAFAETVLRNPPRRFVSEHYVTLRAVSEVTASRDLKVVDFHGPGLSAVGLTNAISTGPYNPCWAWSDYLWSHRDLPDGVAYASRHDPQQICYAIFERPDITFRAAPATQFSTFLPAIRALLRKYDKILMRP
jgi:RES domain